MSQARVYGLQSRADVTTRDLTQLLGGPSSGIASRIFRISTISNFG
jgi:hypothetical protein